MDKFLLIFSVLSLFTIQFLVSVQSAPKNSQEEYFAWHYLKDYNYISKAKHGNHDMKTGVEMFQKFFHLPVTGKLDPATIGEMHKPRCGVPDIEDDTSKARRKRFVVSSEKWRGAGNLTYAFENYSGDLDRSLQEQILAKAFKLWQDVSNLTFHLISDHDIANLTIRFVKGAHAPCGLSFDGPGNVLAHAFFPDNGDLHFDDDELYTDGVTSGTNLLTVATHEIGHLIGIEHTSVTEAVMYSAYQGYDPNFALHQDDIDAVQKLYGGGNHAASNPSSGTRCEDDTPDCSVYASQCSTSGMKTFCRKTCGLCGGGQAPVQIPCADTMSHQSCTWSKQFGFCTTNPQLMAIHCKKTCGLCT